METLRDLLDEIRLGLTERITSPLLGTYIVSWVITNFRVLMVIFGDGTTEQKFSMLDVQLYGGSWQWHWHSVFIFLWHLALTFLWPAILTVFYILGYPKLAKPVYELRLKNLRELTEIRQKIENEQLLSVEASRKLRQENRELKQEIVTRQKDSEQAIDDLQKLLAEEKRKKVNTELSDSEPDLPQQPPSKEEKEEKEETKEQILNKITLAYIASNYGENWSRSSEAIQWLTTNIPGLSQVAARATLDRLFSEHLIEYNPNQYQQRLSSLGRRYVVEHELDNQVALKELLDKYMPGLFPSGITPSS